MKDEKNFFLLSHILVLSILGYLFFPVINLSTLSVRLGDLIVLGLMPLLFMYKPLIPKEAVLKLYLLMLASFFFSMVYGYMFLSVDCSYRDFFEILRLSFPLIVGLFFVNTSKKKIIILLDIFLFYFSFVIIVIGFIQYCFPHSLGGFLTSFYATENHLENYSIFRYKRILLTGSDPNVGASIGLIFLGYNAVKFFTTNKKKYIFLSMLLFLLILFTGSRTGLVACLVLLFTILLLIKSKTKYKFSFLLLSCTLIVLVIPIVPYISIGLKTFLAGKNNSFLVRIDKISDAYSLFIESPFFGWGPAKTVHQTVLDSEWFLLLRRYGVVGVFSFIFFMFYNILRFYKNRILLYKEDLVAYSLAVLLISYSISLFFIILTNNFVSGYQTLLPYSIFVFSVHFRISQIRRNLENVHTTII